MPDRGRLRLGFQRGLKGDMKDGKGPKWLVRASVETGPTELLFYDDHGQRGADFLQPPDVPSDGFLDLLHGVGFDL